MRLFLTECQLSPISPTDCFHGGVSRAATTTMVVSVGQPLQHGGVGGAATTTMMVSVGQPLQPWWCQWGSHYNHGDVSGQPLQPWWCQWGSHYNHDGVNGAATITMMVSVGQPLQPWWCQLSGHYNVDGLNWLWFFSCLTSGPAWIECIAFFLSFFLLIISFCKRSQPKLFH